MLPPPLLPLTPPPPRVDMAIIANNITIAMDADAAIISVVIVFTPPLVHCIQAVVMIFFGG